MTLNRYGLFLHTCSLDTCAMIQKNWFNLSNNKRKTAITISNILHFQGKIYVPVFAKKTSGFHRICSTLFWSNPIGGSEPVPGCSFNSFYLNFLFQKCRIPNSLPDPNGRSEPEPDLLRQFSFILSKHFIYVIHFRVFNYTEAFQMVGP